MVTVLIAFITFALGCTLTYYLNQTGSKKPEVSNLELQEQVQRYRQSMERMAGRLHELVGLAVQSGVDVTLGRTGTADRGPSRGELYTASYEELKRTWRRSEHREADGEPSLTLPESLQFDAAGAAGAAGGGRGREERAGRAEESRPGSGDENGGLENIEEEERLLRQDLSEMEVRADAEASSATEPTPSSAAGTGAADTSAAGTGAADTSAADTGAEAAWPEAAERPESGGRQGGKESGDEEDEAEELDEL